MTVSEVYERVCEVVKPERKLFFSLLNDCISDLTANYGNGAVYFPASFPSSDADKKCIKAWEKITAPIKQGENEIRINQVYHVCLADYIIYRMGGGDVYMQEYTRKAQAAYLSLYPKRLKRVKRLVRKDVW